MRRDVLSNGDRSVCKTGRWTLRDRHASALKGVHVENEGLVRCGEALFRIDYLCKTSFKYALRRTATPSKDKDPAVQWSAVNGDRNVAPQDTRSLTNNRPRLPRRGSNIKYLCITKVAWLSGTRTTTQNEHGARAEWDCSMEHSR